MDNDTITVGQMLPPGVVKGGTAMTLRVGEAGRIRSGLTGRGQHVESLERRAVREEHVGREPRIAVQGAIALGAERIPAIGRAGGRHARHADRVAGRGVNGRVVGVAAEARIGAVLLAPTADRVIDLHASAVRRTARQSAGCRAGSGIRVNAFA